MKEGELLITHHVGDVINILQKTTHYLFDPDDLLTVTVFSLTSLQSSIYIRLDIVVETMPLYNCNIPWFEASTCQFMFLDMELVPYLFQ